MSATELFGNILVPIDGSASSVMAQETAAIIAKKTGAVITVFHVMQEFRLSYDIPREIEDELAGGIVQRADNVVSSARALFSEEGIAVSTETMGSDDPAESILRFSQKNYDLIVMGVHGESEKDPYTLGSVTRKVIMHTKVPTIIAKKLSSLSNMLVCVDGSERSIRALEVAVELAQRIGSKITLFSAQDQRLQKASPKAAEELAEKIFSNALSAVRKGSIKVDKRFEVGVPSDTIVEVAEKGKYDLIVLGSRGLGKVKRFLLGSVSDDVTQKARSSVLVVPAKA
jgi:nucleotide-binding universal stress UspA family protein